MNNPNEQPTPIPGVNIVTGPAQVPNEPTPAPVSNPVPTEGVTLGQVASQPINPQPSMPTPQEAMPMPTPVQEQPVAPEPINPMPMGNALNPQPSMPMGGTNPMPAEPTPIPAPTQEQMPATEPAAPGEETPKKKSVLPTVIIAILLLLVGGFALYYFVLDNPRTVFTKAADTFFDKATSRITNNKGTVDYNLGITLAGADTDTQAMFDVINQIKLKGTYASDGSKSVASGTINYKDKELLNYGLQTEETNIYIKLNNIYDKTILVSGEEELPQYSTDIEDYKQVLQSFKKALDKSLSGANYKKELVSLKGTKVKKITLNVDEKFITTLCNALLQDSSFLDSYSRITTEDQEEITESIKQTIEKAKNNNEDISLYLTLKNEFKMIKYAFEKDEYSIEKNDNQYDFTFVEDGTEQYNGYVKLSETNNQQFLNVSVNLIELKTRVTVSTVYQVDKTKGPELMDTSDAVKYEELSEEETNKITSKLLESEAVTELIKDLGLDGETDLMLSSDM